MRGGGCPDQCCVIIWEGEEGDGAGGEEALVCCYSLWGFVGGRGAFERGDYTVAVVVPAIGGDRGEGAYRTVETVGAHEEAGCYCMFGREGKVGVGREV